MEIRTPRLLLRDFEPLDHEAVHAYASDPEVCRFMEWGPNAVADTAAFLADAMATARTRPRTRYPLAIVEAGAVVGSVQLDVVSPVHRRAEIGYVLRRSRWGDGVATEAALALLRYGFTDLGLHKIVATCDPDNVGSARVLTKLGLRQEGYLRDHLRIRGEWRDRLLFAVAAGIG